MKNMKALVKESMKEKLVEKAMEIAGNKESICLFLGFDEIQLPDALLQERLKENKL